MKKFALLTSALIFASPAYSGSSSNGAISDLYFMDNGAVLFNHSGTRKHLTTDQTCVTQQPTFWGMNATTPEGKAQLSGLLLAFSTGKNITVVGTGDCDPSVHTSRETVKYFYLN